MAPNEGQAATVGEGDGDDEDADVTGFRKSIMGLIGCREVVVG